MNPGCILFKAVNLVKIYRKRTFDINFRGMKRTICFVMAALTVVLGILIVGNLLLIGEKIGSVTHVYLEYVFYLVTVCLLAYFVVLPIARLLLMPEFPKLETEEGWNAKKMRSFAESLSRNCFYISDVSNRVEHKESLKAAIVSAGDDVDALKTVITEEIDVRVKNINSLISRSGRRVFVLTAASQNSTLDALSVIVLNIRLIYDIVCATGYRPNIFQLARIMVSVLGSAFTAYVSQSLTNSLEGGLKNVFANTGFPVIGPILGMLMNGSLNAALTLYVGYTTRNYVLKGSQTLKDEKDTAGVMSSAVSLVAEFIKEKISGVGKSFVERVTDWFRHKDAAVEIPTS